jgi:hypothetical protein
MLTLTNRSAPVEDAEAGDLCPQFTVEYEGHSRAHMLLATLPWPSSIAAIEHANRAA